MPIVKIDNLEYDLDTLSADARANLQMLQLTEQEIQRAQAQLAILQTARKAYLRGLKERLPAAPETAGAPA